MAHGAWQQQWWAALLPILALAAASPQSNYDLQVLQDICDFDLGNIFSSISINLSFHLLRLFQQSTKEVQRPSQSLPLSTAQSLSWVS